MIDLGIYTSLTFPAVSVLVLIFFINFTVSLFLQTILLPRCLTVHIDLLDQRQLSSNLSWVEVLAPVRDLGQQAGSLMTQRTAE